MNRMTTLNARSFDWTDFMPNKRPAVDRSFTAMLFGLGVRLSDNQVNRSRSFSIGADWLIKIAAGYTHDTWADHDGQPDYMKPNRFTTEQAAYVELTLFTFAISIGQRNHARPTVRYFLDGRRVFWKGAE